MVRFEQTVCPTAFGGSTYPYGSSALRNRTRVDEKQEGRVKSEQPYWEKLFEYLGELNDGKRDAAQCLDQVAHYLYLDWKWSYTQKLSRLDMRER